MRRWLLTLVVAAAVTPVATDALAGLWTAISAPSAGAVLHAAAVALRAVVMLWLAVTVLSAGDEPGHRRAFLFDWRALPAPFAAAHGRAARPSARRTAR